MTVLTSSQRKLLDDACVKGRRASERAVRAALSSLAVGADRPPAHLSEGDRQLRRGLRAKARQLGDTGDKLDLLVAECAYEQWHHLVFSRFLVENNLLIHPEYRAPVTIEDCEELTEALGEPDGWAVAGRFAAEILPGIFRLDDPCVRLRLAPEGRLELEAIAVGLSSEIFHGDDALGWVYQSWQKERKDFVNDSERKIGGADLGPVTQLFTDNYMVRFLLQNSLGAWWSCRHPDSPLIAGWEYLQVDDAGRPAAGSFDGWPERVADLTVMDPCCGSGHFLVEAFSMLWQMLAEEQHLAPVEAQDRVLTNNLFGLELDARCVQIAMFAIALQAWKAGGGWRQLPVPSIACSGLPVKASVEDWKALAEGDRRLETALERLHLLFRDAETFGSLIDPRQAAEGGASSHERSLDDVDWDDCLPKLEAASRQERDDPATAVLGIDASTAAHAALLLARSYTLVATNVPFLARGRQSERLANHVERYFKNGKGDLATAMLSRIWEMTAPGGTSATVTPVQWLFLSSYSSFRQELLQQRSIAMLGRLGSRAFTGISGEVASVGLTVESHLAPSSDHKFFHVDLTKVPSPAQKAIGLLAGPWEVLHQARQATNPGSVISGAYEKTAGLLADFADGYAGIQTGDLPRFVRYFWEMPGALTKGWTYYQGTVDATTEWGGLEKVLLWEEGAGSLHQFVSERLGGNVGAWIRGVHCVGRTGVSVSQMGALPVALYSGELFDLNNAVVFPKNPADLPAIWQFCRSSEFAESVRAIDQSLKVTNQTLVKVPFDIEHWREVATAAEELPAPYSDDPTQWIFEGRPEVSTSPLQAAVARLVGYCWPEQATSDDLDVLADEDGIVCLPSVRGEPTAAERLQEMLARAFGGTWSPARTQHLLAASGSKKKELEGWLRDEFFKAHCQIFKSRPFVWQIWDGRKDGLSILVNYHKLDRATLEKLTYSYLGDWIERQTAGVRDDAAGAEERLAAARNMRGRLELILEGEPPYDTYVRWKPLDQQPVGWAPDLNDGVRLNVRPFVEAGVLRSKCNVKWDKDRGTNPDGSERLNGLHFTHSEKQAARGKRT